MFIVLLAEAAAAAAAEATAAATTATTTPKDTNNNNSNDDKGLLHPKRYKRSCSGRSVAEASSFTAAALQCVAVGIKPLRRGRTLNRSVMGTRTPG